MTRFARYSSSGVKKPPCEATPWSELAPPGTLGASHTSPADKQIETSSQKPESGGSVKENNRVTVGKLSRDLGNMDMKNDASSRLNLKGKKLKTPKSVDKKEVKKRKRVLKSVNLDSVAEKVGKCSKKEPRDDGPSGEDFLNHLYPGENGKINGSTLSKVKSKRMKKQKNKSMESNDYADVELTNAEDDANKWSLLVCPPTPAVTEAAPPITNDVPEPVDNTHNSLVTASVIHPRGKKMHKKAKNSFGKGSHSANSTPVLAESKLMTKFDGYWVRRRSVPRLEKVRAELAAAISDPQTLQREMKKRKRAEHRLLLSALAARGSDADAPEGPEHTPASYTGAGTSLEGKTKRKTKRNAHNNIASNAVDGKEANGEGGDVDMQETVPAKKAGVDEEETDSDGEPKLFRPVKEAASRRGDDTEERLVKFDGVWMTGDAVGRLKELRRKLKLQRVSQMVLKQTMKTARRREEMNRKRDLKKVCLGCRKAGHMIAECPQRRDSSRAPITGLCFRCGSTEHRLQDCRHKPATDDSLPYAVCFVCGKTGHLSKECSLNPNGVYPKGGACKVCHQRSHLADDCPERKEEEKVSTGPRLGVFGAGMGIEDDYEHDFKDMSDAQSARSSERVNTGPKPRSVKF